MGKSGNPTFTDLSVEGRKSIARVPELPYYPARF
jgi:hypothetical protein